LDNEKKKGLVDFEEPKKARSLAFAEAFFENISESTELLQTVFSDTILTGYEDSNFTLNLKEIDEITKDARDEFRQHFGSLIESHLAKEGIVAPFGELLERLTRGEIDEGEAIQKLSNIFGFLNDSPFWNGTTMQEHWHSARIESAFYRMGQLQVKFIDKIYDQSQEIIRLKGEAMVAQFLSGASEVPILSDFEQCAEKHMAIAKDILTTKDELMEYAVKVGFLFRDNWWLENHGEAAAEYYERVAGLLAQQSGRKAGAKKTKSKAAKLREACRILVEKAVSEKGLAFAYAPTEIKAHTIRDIAKRDSRSEFEFKSGEVLSLNWFKERIEELSASGEIVKISEAILKKA